MDDFDKLPELRVILGDDADEDDATLLSYLTQAGDAILNRMYPYLDEAQENMPTQKWLMEHCWDYGFILRYPNGSSEITGIIYEPWHYRYVGVEIAQEIRDLGLTFEEYLETYYEPLPEEEAQEEMITEEAPAEEGNPS